VGGRFRYNPKTRSIEHLNRPTNRRNSQAKYGYESWAMAVDPSDVPRAKETLARHGVETQYTPTGEPIIRSRSHRRAHAEALGFYDRNGGYGDPQPKNR
jgi:hypothetical protein